MIYLTFCLYGKPNDKVHETLYVGIDVGEAFKAAYTNQKTNEAVYQTFVQEWKEGRFVKQYDCI